MTDRIQSDSNLVLQRFISWLRSGQGAFLVGAGISYPPPTALPLARDIICSILLNLRKLSPTIRGLFPSVNRYQKLFDKRGSHELRFEALLQVVYDTLQDLSILYIFRASRANANHHMLANACLARNPIITTNFDELIEVACKKYGDIRIVAEEKDVEDMLNVRRQPLWQ